MSSMSSRPNTAAVINIRSYTAPKTLPPRSIVHTQSSAPQPSAFLKEIKEHKGLPAVVSGSGRESIGPSGGERGIKVDRDGHISPSKSAPTGRRDSYNANVAKASDKHSPAKGRPKLSRKFNRNNVRPPSRGVGDTDVPTLSASMPFHSLTKLSTNSAAAKFAQEINPSAAINLRAKDFVADPSTRHHLSRREDELRRASSRPHTASNSYRPDISRPHSSCSAPRPESRPGTSHSRPGTSHSRPLSRHSRPDTALSRPDTAPSRPGTCSPSDFRPGSSLSVRSGGGQRDRLARRPDTAASGDMYIGETQRPSRSRHSTQSEVLVLDDEDVNGHPDDNVFIDGGGACDEGEDQALTQVLLDATDTGGEDAQIRPSTALSGSATVELELDSPPSRPSTSRASSGAQYRPQPPFAQWAPRCKEETVDATHWETLDLYRTTFSAAYSRPNAKQSSRLTTTSSQGNQAWQPDSPSKETGQPGAQSTPPNMCNPRESATVGKLLASQGLSSLSGLHPSGRGLFGSSHTVFKPGPTQFHRKACPITMIPELQRKQSSCLIGPDEYRPLQRAFTNSTTEYKQEAPLKPIGVLPEPDAFAAYRTAAPVLTLEMRLAQEQEDNDPVKIREYVASKDDTDSTPDFGTLYPNYQRPASPTEESVMYHPRRRTDVTRFMNSSFYDPRDQQPKKMVTR